MKNLLILAYECYPHNRPGSTIGAQRPYHFAKHLPSHGFRSIVLCCDYQKRWTLPVNWKLSDVIPTIEQQWQQQRGDTMIIALPSVVHHGFWHQQWRATVSINAALGTFEPKRGLLMSLRRKIATVLSLPQGDYSQSWQPVACQAAEYIHKKLSLDFLLAEHGPDAGIFVARQLSDRLGIPWGVDFRDPLLAPYKPAMRRWVGAHFKKLLSTCKVVFSVNPYWADLDKELFHKPTHIVTNGFDADDFSDNWASPARAGMPLTLLYFGSVKDGQSFETLFAALRHRSQAGNSKPIRFIYYGPSAKAVTDEVKRWGIEKQVEINSMVSRPEVIAKAKQADVLILLSRVNSDVFFRKGFYPGKVFEYFALNKPIISIPEDHGMLDELLGETSTGRSFSKKEDLCSYLNELAERHEKSDVDKQPGKVDRYTRSFQAGVLAKVLDDILKTK